MRELLPREHALWGWLGVPLFAALLTAPTAATAAAVGTAFAGFGAWNAVGRWLRGSARARGPAALAALVALGLAACAIGLAARPIVTAVAFGGAGASAAGVAAWTRGHVRQDPTSEAAGIALLCGFAWLVGVGGGAEPARMGAILAVVLAWTWLGLWWINLRLAPLLPNRTRWVRGPLLVALAVGATAGVAVASGTPLLGLLPLAYLGRVASTGPVRGPRDARRLGLTELAWGLAIALAATRLG